MGKNVTPVKLQSVALKIKASYLSRIYLRKVNPSYSSVTVLEYYLLLRFH